MSEMLNFTSKAPRSKCSCLENDEFKVPIDLCTTLFVSRSAGGPKATLLATSLKKR